MRTFSCVVWYHLIVSYFSKLNSRATCKCLLWYCCVLCNKKFVFFFFVLFSPFFISLFIYIRFCNIIFFLNFSKMLPRITHYKKCDVANFLNYNLPLIELFSWCFFLFVKYSSVNYFHRISNYTQNYCLHNFLMQKSFTELFAQKTKSLFESSSSC